MDKKILLVDDAAFMRMLISNTLTTNGYTNILEAADGEIAVSTYSAEKPDLVIMDITMPNKTGIEALKEIKAMEDANILIIKGKYKVQLDEDVKYISSNCSVDDDGIVTTDDSDENLSYIVY